MVVLENGYFFHKINCWEIPILLVTIINIITSTDISFLTVIKVTYIKSNFAKCWWWWWYDELFWWIDQRKAFNVISGRDHCQRSSPSPISDTPRAGSEPAWNLSSGLVEWRWAVVITTRRRRHNNLGKCCSYKIQYILIIM